MGKGSKLKRKDGNVVTKKMITDRMEDMATLMTAMEAALMEWEIWYRLIPQQKKCLTQEQFEMFVLDGPILTEFPGKIMESIRKQMPAMEPLELEEVKKPLILDSTGLPAQSANNVPKILDSTGHTQNPLG
jgi:hypothetical protein